MTIRIIAVGKLKEEYLELGINEYIKRLKKYASVEIVEVKDEAVKEENIISITKAKDIEGERVLKLLKPNDYVIALDLNKTEFKSEDFAEFLRERMAISGAYITFIIGGSYGLSNVLQTRANSAVSLSKMTFLHTMTRLILLEQVYRSFKIINHEVYHK